MPIRFRCAYCNQLMAIARRKAGTVVRCPKCTGQVVVPTPEEGPDDQAGPDVPEPAAGKNGGLFEVSDFEKVFQAPVPEPKPPPLEGPRSAVRPAPATDKPPRPNVPRREMKPSAAVEAPAPRGLLLTPGWLTLVCIIAVLLVGLAFFLGLMIGRG